MSSGIQIGFQLQINKDGDCLLESGRIELLRQIHKTGSLNAASKAVKISYQTAWNIINDINLKFTQPLVNMQRGGSGGGGANLTESGLRFIKEFEWIEKQVTHFFGKLNTEITV